MRVVHIITTLGMGGAERHLLSLVKGQIKSGVDVSIVYLKEPEDLRSKFIEAGVRSVVKFPFENFGHLRSCLMQIRHFIKELQPEIVHTHLLKANAIGGFAAFMARSRSCIIASKHNDENILKNPVIGIIHGILSAFCDSHVITLSDHVLWFMRRYGFIPQRKLTRVYYGFDRGLYDTGHSTSDIRKSFDIPSSDFVFGIIARVTEQKGQLYALRAMAGLRRNFPETRLLFVGGPGYNEGYLNQVKREVDRLDLNSVVHLAGWRADAFQVMGDLDCLLLPSVWEGFGLVLLEATFQGLPVVATRAGAIPEVIRDGIDGILANPADADSLQAAMSEMIRTHRTYRERLAKSGKGDVLKRFPVDRMVAQTLEVYARAASLPDLASVL